MRPMKLLKTLILLTLVAGCAEDPGEAARAGDAEANPYNVDAKVMSFYSDPNYREMPGYPRRAQAALICGDGELAA